MRQTHQHSHVHSSLTMFSFTASFFKRLRVKKCSKYFVGNMNGMHDVAREEKPVLRSCFNGLFCSFVGNIHTLTTVDG